MEAGRSPPGGVIIPRGKMKNKTSYNFQDKVILITGGEGAIGTAITDAFLSAGGIVFCADRKKNQNILSDRIFIEMNVKSPDSVKSGIEKILQEKNRIDVLVVAAGVQLRKPALDVSVKDWSHVIETNLYGSFFTAQNVAKGMVNRGSGRIIFISSLTSEIGLPNMVPYVASRGGIKQLSKALAVEFAVHGVTVNCVGPGRIITPMTKDIFSDDDLVKDVLRLIPQDRAGTPEDIVGATLFLASNEASYITGQSIYVDGGWLAGGGNSKT